MSTPAFFRAMAQHHKLREFSAALVEEADRRLADGTNTDAFTEAVHAFRHFAEAWVTNIKETSGLDDDEWAEIWAKAGGLARP